MTLVLLERSPNSALIWASVRVLKHDHVTGAELVYLFGRSTGMGCRPYREQR